VNVPAGHGIADPEQAKTVSPDSARCPNFAFEGSMDIEDGSKAD